MDRDFKYNYERYYDPTVYMALSNVQKGERMVERRIGEIWEYTLPNRNETNMCLVIADDGNVITFLRLIDAKNDKHDIEVPCRGMMYASSRMISYGFPQIFESYVKTVSEDLFKDIKNKIAASLEIESGVVVKVEEKEVTPEPVMQISESVSFDAELERTKAQLEVYKGLYENLLQKMVR